MGPSLDAAAALPLLWWVTYSPACDPPLFCAAFHGPNSSYCPVCGKIPSIGTGDKIN